MSTVNWLLYATLVGGLLTLAAWQAGRAASLLGRPGRWGWILAALATVALPLWARIHPAGDANRVLPLGPEWQWPVGAAATGPVDVVQSVPIETGSPASGPSPLLWPLLSLVTLGWVLASQRSLAHRRQQWRRETLLGRPVAISEDFGPAVVGILRPELVIPSWAVELPEDSLELVLRHEQEHLSNHDSRLLGVMAALLVLMPWQPFLWLQLAGLRLAIELDCDRRVLVRHPGVRRYGDLLLQLAESFSRTGGMGRWSLQFAALWVRSSQLERRLKAMSAASSGSRLPLIGASSLAVLTIALACATTPPVPPASPVPPAAPATPVTPTTPASPAEPWTPEAEQARQAAELQQQLSQYFRPPTEKKSGKDTPVYWFVSEPDGSLVRHVEGGTEILWVSEADYRKRWYWLYEKDLKRADSTGLPFPKGGVFSLTNSKVYQRFPDLGDRRVGSYGLSPVPFGVDTVMVVWAKLLPEGMRE